MTHKKNLLMLLLATSTIILISCTRHGISHVKQPVACVTSPKTQATADNKDLLLASAWQQAMLSIEKQSMNKRPTCQSHVMPYFIMFTENTLGISVPDFWAKSILNADIIIENNKAKILFHNIAPRGTGARIVATNSMSTSVQIDSRTIVLDQSASSIFGSQVAFARTDVGDAISIYPNISEPFPIQLLTKSNEIVWKNMVQAEDGVVNYTGQPWHYATIISCHKSIYIFGISPLSAYIEAFDVQSGEAEWRFSTCDKTRDVD